MQEAKEFISLLGEAIEKGVFELPNGSGDRIQMFARGPYQSGESYRRGDVVSVANGPIYICLEDTLSDPRSNSTAWLILQAIGYGGGYSTGGSVTPPVVSSLFSWSDDDGKLLALDDAELSWTFNLGAPIGYPLLTYGTGGPVAGSWSNVGSKIIFTPSADYNVGDVIIVDFSAVLDANGDPLVGVPSPWTYQVAGFLLAGAITPVGTVVTPTHPDNFAFKYTKIPASTPTPTARYSTGVPVAGTWVVDGFTHKFIQSGTLNPSETITFRFDNVKDATGEPLISPPVFTYAVQHFMFVSLTTTSGDQVATALEQVFVTFNGAPAPASLQQPVDNDGLTVPGSWSVSGNVATFTPTATWANYAAPFDFGVFSVQGVNAPPPPAPVSNLTFVDFVTGQIDGTVDNADEFIMLRFNGAVDPASVPAIFVSYDRAGGTLPAGVSYYQVQNGMSAPHVGFVITPPAGGWPLTDDGFFDIDISAFTSSGVAVTNPQVVNVPTTLIAPAFTFVSSATPNGDGSVDGGDAIFLTFSEEPDVASTGLPFFNQGGVPVSGFYAMPIGSSTIEYLVAGDWADVPNSFSFKVDLAGLKSKTGTLISNPSTLTFPLRRVLTQQSFTPVAGSRLTGSTALTVTFNTNPYDGVGSAPRLPGVTENGVGMPGSWAPVAGTGTVRFTPSRPWTPGATVLLDWAGVIDRVGTLISNPGSQTFQVLDQFLFVDSDPANNGRVYVNGQIQLRFNKPVDLSSLLWPRHNGNPVPGTWSYVGGDQTRAIYISNPDIAPSTPLLVDYSNARSTAGDWISNPGFRTFAVAPPMVFNFAFPAPGSNLTGSSAFFVDFDMPPNASTMPSVFYLLPASVTPQVKPGTWATSGNRAIFTPLGAWGTTANIIVQIGANVKSVWGTPVSNQTTFSYTST